MKKIITILASLAVFLSLEAQPPMGGGQGGGRPPMRGQGNFDRSQGGDSSEVGVLKFPEIQGLTAAQREKLIKAVTDERKNVMSLMDSKRELHMKAGRPDQLTEKDAAKLEVQTKKIDAKIDKVKAKADKKYRSILAPDQYQVFMDKKAEIEFKGGHKQGGRAQQGNRPQRSDDDFDGGGTPPDMPMDGGGF